MLCLLVEACVSVGRFHWAANGDPGWKPKRLVTHAPPAWNVRDLRPRSKVCCRCRTAAPAVWQNCGKTEVLHLQPSCGVMNIAWVKFFFLWYGRSRSKARSLHEKKQLLRKLLHGHRWSHAAWQIIKTKTQTTKNKRQDADPPARFASHHPKDSKANSERCKSPTETTTKDLPRTQW